MREHQLDFLETFAAPAAPAPAVPPAQEDVVLAFFQKYPLLSCTPFDVQARALPGVPITSVRRALNRLVKRGHLVKTGKKRLGPHGQQNHTWRLVCLSAE